MDGRLEEYYVAVGSNTIFLLVDVPDAVSLSAIFMAVVAGGAVSSIKSTAIITAEEAVDAMKKARDVAYRPPAS